MSWSGLHGLYNRKIMAVGSITGSLIALFLYDVSDEIRLDELRGRLKAPPAGREPPFRQPAPEYVQFEKPPVIETRFALKSCRQTPIRWTCVTT